MARIIWDALGERLYETGVDHGVLYLSTPEGYTNGVPWNGLTSISESPEGAESNPQYADNIKYINIISNEEFKATLEAFTYPDEFEECDGSVELSPGVTIGQQNRKMFGLCYRTYIGNDVDGQNHGYRLHLVYGCNAAPTEKQYQTINESPEPASMSWELNTTPVAVTGHKPTSILTVNSTKVDPAKLKALEDILYGSEAEEPRLPLPDEVNTIIPASLP